MLHGAHMFAIRRPSFLAPKNHSKLYASPTICSAPVTIAGHLFYRRDTGGSIKVPRTVPVFVRVRPRRTVDENCSPFNVRALVVLDVYVHCGFQRDVTAQRRPESGRFRALSRSGHRTRHAATAAPVRPWCAWGDVVKNECKAGRGVFAR